MDKNSALNARFNIGDWPRYDYDVDHCTLVFSEGKGKAPRVRASIQLVGSVALGAGTWLWAWANDWWPKPVCEAAETACRFGEEHGIEELISGYATDDDLNELGWAFTAIAAKVVGALGGYRTPTDDGYLFFVYREISWAS
jgi:hypothetical protein